MVSSDTFTGTTQDHLKTDIYVTIHTVAKLQYKVVTKYFYVWGHNMREEAMLKVAAVGKLRIAALEGKGKACSSEPMPINHNQENLWNTVRP